MWKRWQLCRLLHIAPEPGSLADQNPWEMEMFRILESREQNSQQKSSAGLLAVTLGSLFGRKL